MQREESYEEQIRDLTARLKDVSKNEINLFIYLKEEKKNRKENEV
jgi:uncharacterized protein YktB (UPF0637 family)